MALVMPRAIIRRIPSYHQRPRHPLPLKIGVTSHRLEQPAARHRIEPVDQESGAATIRRDDHQLAVDLEARRPHHSRYSSAVQLEPKALLCAVITHPLHVRP